MSGTLFEVCHAFRRVALVQFNVLLSICTRTAYMTKSAASNPAVSATKTFDHPHSEAERVCVLGPKAHTRLPMILSHPMYADMHEEAVAAFRQFESHSMFTAPIFARIITTAAFRLQFSAFQLSALCIFNLPTTSDLNNASLGQCCCTLNPGLKPKNGDCTADG